MDLNDVTPENFFKKVTYSDNPTPEGKIVIPNGDFILAAINLRLINVIERLRQQL